MRLDLPFNTRPSPRAIYYVTGKVGYFVGFSGGDVNFVQHSARRLAPKFSIEQACKIAAKCQAYGHAVDVSVV